MASEWLRQFEESNNFGSLTMQQEGLGRFAVVSRLEQKKRVWKQESTGPESILG
jgi:hypothetical protein